jgi:hypothetical protein
LSTRLSVLHWLIDRLLLPLEFIRAMATPVRAAVTATREEARREDYALALPIKILALHERLSVSFGAHSS